MVSVCKFSGGCTCVWVWICVVACRRVSRLSVCIGAVVGVRVGGYGYVWLHICVCGWCV